jgi:hypothetical protein
MAKHIRGQYKNVYASAVFTKLENYIGAGAVDQYESIVQPMDQ